MINKYIYGTPGTQTSDSLTGTDLTNDYIDGYGGADTMSGLGGNDTYVVDNVGDVIIESVNGGTDTVNSSINYSIASDLNLENVTLVGSANINATGNSGDNVLFGNSGNNVLTGGDGNDTYLVNNYGDTVVEGNGANSGTDTIISTVSLGLDWFSPNVENLTLADGGTATIACGNTSNNILTGNSQNNILNGFAGADTMIGGGGNDIYVVDNVNDVVIETATASLHNNDADSIYAWVDYTVSSGVENLVFRAAGLTATGNELNNTYTVVDATDRVVEGINGGRDTVLSGVTYTLDANVENLTLTGTSAINGTGNAGDNVLTGNAANNVLIGGDGNDTYYINSYGDTVVEQNGNAGGIDTIVSSVSIGLDWYAPDVENLTLTGGAAVGVGNALDNIITGNSAANTLVGRGGADRLVGGLGNDWLWGDGSLAARAALGITGAADTFVFDTALVGARNGGVDRIGDFTTSDGDKIELSSSIFSNIGGGLGALGAGEFESGAGMNASSSSAHIVYDTSSGMLYYDTNGSAAGGSVAFAQLDNLASLSSNDFVVA